MLFIKYRKTETRGKKDVEITLSHTTPWAIGLISSIVLAILYIYISSL